MGPFLQSSPREGAKGRQVVGLFYAYFLPKFLPMQYYLYILFSKQADKFYVGHSNNPWERLLQHNSNKIEKYTGKYTDWEIKAVFYVSENRGDADKLERYIKRQKSRNLLLKLVDKDFSPTGELAQLDRVPQVRD